MVLKPRQLREIAVVVRRLTLAELEMVWQKCRRWYLYPIVAAWKQALEEEMVSRYRLERISLGDE